MFSLATSSGHISRIAKQRWKNISEAVIRETPTQSSALLDRQVQVNAKPSTHDAGEGTRGASVTDVQYGVSEADVK